VGTRRLTLLRHAKAQSIDSCAEDFERALTRRGCIEAEEIARVILQRGLVPDLILVSPAERAWATAEIVAKACELDAKQLQCARELYLGTPESIWRVVQARDAGLAHVMICGHNPGLSQIASRLGPSPQPRELPTAGIASAEWRNASWEDLQPESAEGCEQEDPDEGAEL
jgi:phosphohistidine phosphatase